MADQPSAVFTNEDFDNLLVGDYPVQTEIVTLSSGENVTRGAVLGKVTANGEYKLSLAGAGDGSETPHAIAAEDIDASGGDKNGLIYTSAEVNQRKLSFGAGHDADSVREPLRLVNIYVKGSDAA